MTWVISLDQGLDGAEEDWKWKDIAVARVRSYEGLKYGKDRRASEEGIDS